MPNNAVQEQVEKGELIVAVNATRAVNSAGEGPESNHVTHTEPVGP